MRWFQQRALIVGAGRAGRGLLEAMQAAPSDANPYRGTGYHILGFIDDDVNLYNGCIGGVPVLGNHARLEELVHSLHIDQVILAITQRHAIDDRLFKALLGCRERGGPALTMTTVYERLTGRVPIDHVGGELERVLPMEDDPGERAYRPGQVSLPRLAGHVVFDTVTFRYKPDRPEVLRQLSFTVPAGQLIWPD